MKKVLLILFMLAISTAFLFSQNPRNVLVYNITSTDCGPCSCMDSLFVHRVLPTYPNTIIVAFHGIGSAFRDYQGNDVVNSFHALYEPSGFIDGLGYDVPYFFITDSVGKRYQHSPEAPVKIEIVSKTWNPTTRLVDLSLQFTNLGEELQGMYRYNIIVTEDNIKRTHRTATGCSTPDVPGLPFRNNYFNSFVTRSMIYLSKGDSLIGPSWPAQQVVAPAVCSFAIDTAWIPENCNIVVTVYKNADSLYKANIQQALRQSVTYPVGIQESLSGEEPVMKVCPNPSHDWTNIHLTVPRESLCNLRIFDIMGREVVQLFNGSVKPGLYNFEIDTRDYQAGTYIAVLKTDAGTTQARIIVR